jgi:isopenicillin N synthase-like dioxygenase
MTTPTAVVDMIPVIDLSQPEDVVVSELLQALTTIGFATLINHGVPSDTMDRAWTASQQFFALSEPQKLQYKYQGQESNRGYIPFQFETHGSGVAPDLKETFDIGKENDPVFQNVWPAELNDDATNINPFRTDLLKYFETMDQLHLRILKWIGMGLQLEDVNFLVDRCNDQHENLRLLHYPSVVIENEDMVRGNIHSDYGTITLLLQDQVGGLKVQTVDGKWIPVPPVPGAIVLNVGDMLMRWSNNVLKATLHQVVAPPKSATNDGTMTTTTMASERYSMAFFCNANKDAMIECLPPCCQTKPALYPPINSHVYLTQRLKDTVGMTTNEG